MYAYISKIRNKFVICIGKIILTSDIMEQFRNIVMSSIISLCCIIKRTKVVYYVE